jgi:hypothetical protein
MARMIALRQTMLLALCSMALAAAAASAPEGWLPLKVNDKKKPTRYAKVTEDGRAALHARAEASASGAYRKADFNLADRPVASWSWKIARLIDKADNSKGSGEDSPARLVLAFDGDKSRLPMSDQAVMRLAKKLSGQNLPYATLMYIWSKDAPVGTVIPNPHSRRIQMIVAASGPGGVGTWQDATRDVAEDFRRAFKEEPGKLLAYGVMTDTDNTGESVDAWYGGIEFKPPR